jgi:hypothetical protein
MIRNITLYEARRTRFRVAIACSDEASGAEALLQVGAERSEAQRL